MTPTERHRRIAWPLKLDGEGIEYGPLSRPIINKDHHKVRYVDFTNRAALVDHYKNDPSVDVAAIREIDIVTNGKPITDFVVADSLDYVVASHVWEHVPDFLGWLETNLAVLKPGGRIAVAYPDKRYCFDMARRSSTVADVLAAYIEKRQRPTFTQICDHFLNAVETSPLDAWSGKTTPQNAKRIHHRETIVQFVRSLYDAHIYVDCHCWVFEDSEFLLLLSEAKTFCNMQYEIMSFLPTPQNSNEFFITLEKSQ